MDVPWGTPNAFGFLVSEHARAVVAIQELQQEVTSLLTFREHVLETLPHLKVAPDHPTEASPRARASSNKSLSEGPSTNGPSTVADSGFSTDKASTSMGKSSSSSSGGELSGGPRWTCVEPEAGGPLGSAEDELWQLLEVIQKKGSRLRTELEKAEIQEREYGHSSDPALTGPSRVPPATSAGDFWPHSLPGGAGPRIDMMSPGLEAWGEAERLRQDRCYLLGRVSRAEAEAAASHSRLLDLHSQLISIATEKRRLEDTFRTLRLVQESRGPDLLAPDPYAHPSHWGLIHRGSGLDVTGAAQGAAQGASTSKVHIGDSSPKTRRTQRGVTVSVKSDHKMNDPYRKYATDDDVVLPRVLKVSIRDKGEGSSSSSSSSNNKVQLIPDHKASASASASVPLKNYSSDVNLGSDRVVIERQRTTSKVDGGLSMPASLLKGTKIKVAPDKQRISAILREKDVLALQKQLLTTVMETEVLKRQLECASDEWSATLEDWEVERQKGKEQMSALNRENKTLREQADARRKIVYKDATASASVSTHNVCVGTDPQTDPGPDPTYTVHQGPNVKYDVVIYEESTQPTKGGEAPSPAPRKLSMTDKSLSHVIEKPPRKCRETRPPFVTGVGGGVGAPLQRRENHDSFGRDSFGRIAKVSLKPSFSSSSCNPSLRATPTATPRSSPASSISAVRTAGARTPSSILRNGLSSNPRPVSRKDSLKGTQIQSPSIPRKGNSTPTASNSATNSGLGAGAATGKVRSRGPSFINRWLNMRE